MSMNRNSAIDAIVNQSSVGEAYASLADKDEIAAEMACEIWGRLRERLGLDDRESEAWNRFVWWATHHAEVDPALARNNLAKAANCLGLRTPISF